ncbi:MAG: hypothetical protein LC793_06790 [Thermomicrobia bacterium]|nr:hypothetical protein [Thermomicrobia bacterium]
MRRKGIALLVIGLVMFSVMPVAAAPPTPENPAGKILGVVPPKGQSNHRPGSGSNLSYHGGPVMHTNTVYAIYWIPTGYSVSSGYQSIINGFFTNVAADNGGSSNVYYSDTQYYDGSGTLSYASTFAGSYVDTTPFPANGCSDAYTSVCLSDAQLQSEIAAAMHAKGWTGGTNKLYFLFTPKNVGSCSGSSCAFSNYCAYHSWFGSGSTVTLYANQPYAAFVPSACDAGQHPNGDDADATINVTSHEQNEAITDQQGSAWYDSRGQENGDKCAWNFGTALGTVTGAYYNQVIGGGKYYLQQEWSNATTRCVLTGK